MAAVTAGLAGTWTGTATHQGESVRVSIEFEPLPGGQLAALITLPIVRFERVPIAKAAPQVRGNEIEVGMLRFEYDAAARSLKGDLPDALVPVHKIPFVLHRVDRAVGDPKPAPGGTLPQAPLVAPSWVFDAGAACWPGATFSRGLVFVGCDDGRLHALDGETGRQRWSFRAGGPIRTRATATRDAVFFQADDGVLYKLGAVDGAERWRVRLVEGPVRRLPLTDPSSRFDCFGSDVALWRDRLYVGTHDGRIVSAQVADGKKLWEFRTGDSIVAAPAVAGGRVYAGSFDKYLYALDAATGRLAWKRDTQGAIVSTPAIDGTRLVVGTRAYDLIGFDTARGDASWRRYIWFSWVESSPTLRRGVAYVGSSDAAAVFAVDLRTGRPVWKADVGGWAWGQPAAAGNRLYVGTSSQPAYMDGLHKGAAVALDLRTGRPAWRFTVEPGSASVYGFAGSAAIGRSLVFFAGLDGKVYAFAK